MKPYQALIWNEWRQICGNVLALAGVTALLWLMLLFGSYNKSWTYYIEMIAGALTLGLPLLYSIVLADSFAREFSQKTDSFLLELPVSPTKIFFCKYLANLLPFLGLVIFETLLMLRLAGLTQGKYFTHDLQYGDWIIALGTIAATWILPHAMVFFASLLSRKTGNGIVAIIIMPLLIVLLLPGTMAITMFFVMVNDISTWPKVFMPLVLIILYCFCIGFGVYLWARRISCGKRILKPVIAALALILTVPWILYGTAYLYFNLSFNSAIREARTAGLEMDSNKLLPPPVPAEQNAMPGILKFYNEYKPIDKLYFGKNTEYGKTLGPLPSQCISDSSWTNTNFSFSGVIHENIPRKNILEVAEFIMKDPRMNQCYNILSEALKKPYCRFSRNSASTEYSDDYFIGYRASNFLSDRAYALRISGRDDDFFACLAGIDKIANALTEQPFRMMKEFGLRSKTIEYRTAIDAGPDTVEAVKFYNEMICNIDLINPVMPDETFRIYSYLKGSDEYLYLWRDFQNGNLPGKINKLFLPGQFQIAAALIRWKIQADKLLKQAITSESIKAIEPTLDSLRKSENKTPGFFTSDIYSYFRYRAEFESYKLCLALKVYNIRYGKFPDSLQQLAPEILPKVPVNPQTGKDYIYRSEADGFYLSSYANARGIKYQTWKIETENAK